MSHKWDQGVKRKRHKNDDEEKKLKNKGQNKLDKKFTCVYIRVNAIFRNI